MRILSLHDGHNAAAALIENGSVIFAIQEERLTNLKNFFGFPKNSVAYILQKFNLSPSHIDKIVLSTHFISAPMDSKKVSRHFGWQGTPFALIVKKISKLRPLQVLREKKSKKRRINILSGIGFPREKIEFTDHHSAHAASAYYGLARNPSKKYLILTLDGGGDWLCATVSIAQNGKINRIAETPYGHSIGDIYSRITYMMGFTPWEHEYKLMGMAPYTSREHSRKIADILHRYIDLDPHNNLIFKKKIFEDTNHILPRLERDLKRQRFDNIAGGVQLFTEEVILRWVRACIAKTGIHDLLAGGGVFMNIKANKLISELPEIDTFEVFPSCGDESNIFGGGWIVSKSNGENPKPINNYYFGPSFSDTETESILRREHAEGYFTYTKKENINEFVAELLAKGNIVARASGHMEFGARALGNRSIFADPSLQNVVPIINALIKSRDFWMPFAPIALADKSEKYIKNEKRLRSPYMMMGFDTTEKRNDIVAGLHPADKSARMQLLERDQNPDVKSILEKFEQKTGRAALLNTSFNLHGYPIVFGPQEALYVFKNSGLLHLVIGNYYLSKNE